MGSRSTSLACKGHKWLSYTNRVKDPLNPLDLKATKGSSAIKSGKQLLVNEDQRQNFLIGERFSNIQNEGSSQSGRILMRKKINLPSTSNPVLTCKKRLNFYAILEWWRQVELEYYWVNIAHTHIVYNFKKIVIYQMNGGSNGEWNISWIV